MGGVGVRIDLKIYGSALSHWEPHRRLPAQRLEGSRDNGHNKRPDRTGRGVKV